MVATRKNSESSWMTPFDETFYPIFLTGVLISGLLAFFGGRFRGFVIPIVFLVAAIIPFWVALFLGSELGYRNWQAMENPPDEAFADTMPLGALLFGWMPASIFSFFVLGVSVAIRFLQRKLFPKEERIEDSYSYNTEPVETGNPFRSR